MSKSWDGTRRIDWDHPVADQEEEEKEEEPIPGPLRRGRRKDQTLDLLKEDMMLQRKAEEKIQMLVFLLEKVVEQQ